MHSLVTHRPPHGRSQRPVRIPIRSRARTTTFGSRWPVVVAATLALLLGACAQFSLTEDATESTAPTPLWAQGRTAEQANSKLSPYAPRLEVTALEDIPVDRIKMPPGFRAEVWAHGLPGARTMTRGADGTVYVGSNEIGRVYAVTVRRGKREVKVLAEGLTQPNGVLYTKGALYVIALDRVLRYDAIDRQQDSPPKPLDLTSAFALPSDAHHGSRLLGTGMDNKFYVTVGAPCNICEPGPDHAQIRRYNRDGAAMEVVARGVRNPAGFDFHPRTGQLWFVDNGRDWMGEDEPEDELNRVSVVGADFGFPYCHAGGLSDREFPKQDACADVTMPVASLGPHTNAQGMRFYTGKMFPLEYRGSILLVRQGSWSRERKSGFDLVRINARNDGSNARITPFVSGFLNEDTQDFWGRPADVLQLPDGSILVSDEHQGAIYRISYWRR